MGRNIIIWLVFGAALLALFNLFQSPSSTSPGSQVAYSDFIAEVEGQQVVEVVIDGRNLKGTAKNGRIITSVMPEGTDVVQVLDANDVRIIASPEDSGMPSFLSILLSWFPMLLFIGIWVFFMRQMQGGSRGAMGFGKSRAKLLTEHQGRVTFEDVAGIDEAKTELEEVVEFLKDPGKFQRLGGKIPKGVLLVGPPGTGKTLLAKAIAGEANVPFFTISGSDFVEMFVGVGASRVRDMFEQGKKNAPCIIFIDEIDAVGRQRGTGMGGGNDEREQTINQLLTELDGFEGNTGVIVLAATNRPDVLDKALLRPGRFDRQVTVDRPDLAGRVRILKVHSKGKVLAGDVDLEKVARRTPGMTGADLQNLMNEAAIFAARRNLKEVSKEEIADALERIVAGVEKKGAVMSEKKRKLVAYHEAGHAVVGALLPDYDSVTKISIVPRGAAGGLTFFAPSEERLESGLYSRSYLENQMAVAMGGRIAEELIFGADNVTTGASGDFMQVSRTAKQMVTQVGFSDKLGQVAYGGGGGPSFLGQQMGQSSDFSGKTAALIDEEVKILVERAYRRAKDLMQNNMPALHALADLLLEKENVDGDEFERMLQDMGCEQYLKADEPSIAVPFQ